MSNTSSANSSVFKVGIDRLQSESDFYTWEYLATSHLKRYELWGVVSGTTPRPASTPASTAGVRIMGLRFAG